MENGEFQPGAPETVGVYLREIRQSRGITPEEVSESTGISTSVLLALENGDREQLPAEVYIKAFYIKYAEFLGLETEEIQAKYRQQAENLKKTGRSSSLNTVITLKGQGENLFAEIFRRLFLPIAVLILGLIFYWIYKNYLAPYNPLGFYQDNIPAVYSFLASNAFGVFC